ncbi:unnamed protein product [Sphagnum balticum]
MEQFGDRLKDVEIIVTAVLHGSRASMINVKQCQSLANVCTGIENHLKEWMLQMECRVDAENYVRLLPLLDEVVRVLERGKILVLQYGSAQWFELAVTRGDNQEAFREIHLLLETNMQVLYNHINELYGGILRDSKVTEILIAKEFMRANAEHDHDKILETLQMFQKNLPKAIAKLKGTSDMDNLPVNMRIDAREVKCGEKIGKGAYGLVRKAHWLGCNFAAKIIRTSNIDALRKEVGILARLSHPHIVQLVGFSTDCATSMILMELMDSDLRHLIKYRVNWTPQTPPFPPEVPIDIICLNSTPQTPPFPPEVAIDIISQIAAGMAYLHKQGIFHGDLKASNVLVNHRGDYIEAKIADFGVSQTVQLTKCFDASKNTDRDMASGSSIYSNSSFSGIVGTTGWRAPEVSHIQVSV